MGPGGLKGHGGTPQPLGVGGGRATCNLFLGKRNKFALVMDDFRKPVRGWGLCWGLPLLPRTRCPPRGAGVRGGGRDLAPLMPLGAVWTPCR